MLARDSFPVPLRSPFLVRVPVLAERIVQTPRNFVQTPRNFVQTPQNPAYKLTPGLRPLHPRNTLSSAGSISSGDSRDSIASPPLFRATIAGCGNQESVKRPRVGDLVGPAPTKATPPRETIRIGDTLQERLMLGEKCLQLQADANQRASELQAMHEQTKALWWEYAKCQREKLMLEEKVKVARSQKKEEPVCVICLAEQASHAIVPCGHLVLCGNCCSHPIHNCPLCRQSCQQKIRVFRP
eukprot:TRINITY_DN488_c0_g1_i1.p1 TRINITY_DN488_c0_g1~~TRINITY_DN488_c0_g1_i1.p1  ORF type:complete len:258 (-),score=21.63 TRINITY_DN488_c0_g1_i1:342-1064(-)